MIVLLLKFFSVQTLLALEQVLASIVRTLEYMYFNFSFQWQNAVIGYFHYFMAIFMSLYFVNYWQIIWASRKIKKSLKKCW